MALLTALLIMPLIGRTQIAKGTNMFSAGFNLYFDNDKQDDFNDRDSKSNTINIGISPSWSSYVAENLALGFGLSISSNKSKSTDELLNQELIQNSHSLHFGPTFFIRKNIPINDKIGWYIHPSMGYRKNEFTSERITSNDLGGGFSERNEIESTNKSDQVFMNTSIGLLYRLSPKFSIETDIQLFQIFYQVNENLLTTRDLTFRPNGESLSSFTELSESKGLTIQSALQNSYSIDRLITFRYYW